MKTSKKEYLTNSLIKFFFMFFRDHSKKKCLTRIFLTWKEFAKSEFDRQVCDFTFNLAMKTSRGSTFLSTSGYQTSFKNSDSSFLFFTSDKNEQTLLLPKSTSRSRPFSPTGDQVYKGFSMLPIYYPVSRCVYPTVKLFNYEQECPRSSEEETIPFSDVLSFDVDSSEAHISFPQYEGEENDLVRMFESINFVSMPYYKFIFNKMTQKYFLCSRTLLHHS